MKLWKFIPAIVWLITATYLLCMPGDDLPDASFLSIPYFDKFVHLVIFFMITFLFSFPFVQAKQVNHKVLQWVTTITIISIIFGVAIEFVQKYLVRDRSFDIVDIVFDGMGSLAALVIVRIWYKRIGPDRNRGRNQN